MSMSIPEGDQFGCSFGSTLFFRDRLTRGNKFLGLLFFIVTIKNMARFANR